MHLDTKAEQENNTHFANNLILVHISILVKRHRKKEADSYVSLVFGARANILQRAVQSLAAFGERSCSGRCKHVFRKIVSKTKETA